MQQRRGPGGGFGGGGGPLGLGAPRQKPKDFKKTMKKLIKLMSPYRWLFLLCVIFAVGSTVFGIAAPVIMEGATGEIIRGFMEVQIGGFSIDFSIVLRVILILGAVYIVSALFMFLQSLIMADMTQKISYSLRKDMSAKISRLPLNYFDTKTHGEVLSRIVNDVDTVANSLNQSLTQIVTSVVTVVGILAVMFWISWQMTLVALVTVPMSAILVMIVIRFSQKHFRRQQEYVGHVNGQVEEIYGGHVVVKAFCAEDKSVGDFDNYNNTLYQSAWKAQFLSGIIWPAMSLIGNIGYVGVSVLGGVLVSRGSLRIENILTFIQYIRRFNMPIMQLGQISNMLQSTVAAAERVFEFLEQDELAPEADESSLIRDISVIRGSVSFSNVDFGYVPDTPIIKNFTTDVDAGKTIAIVGPTGGGKTTIVKLLMRFYELNGGSIEIDGINITNFTRADLRSMLAMVLQDTWLFNGTIMDNLRYGKLNATDVEVYAAADAARVDHFVRALPGGYDMELNEEATNISQGQKQLITIARAILKDPKILILDEATSSVDTRTEVLIQEAMVNLMRGRTSFIIAHRLSTIRGADAILVVRDGEIVEQGSHEALLAAGGYYKELYESQFV
ncbi:MAG: ABC transporter ATP-binding protein/permease [Defluviitaleaceae bacterium]|nr:ABC transporter ATP-binding protein/permease [Defluviitaleaceae bacterium]